MWMFIFKKRGPSFNYSEMGILAVLAGIDTVDGVAAHHLQFTWPDGDKKEYFFDVEKGQLIVTKSLDQRGLIHTSKLDEYGKMGGFNASNDYITCSDPPLIKLSQ